jgi:hypothetical protein
MWDNIPRWGPTRLGYVGLYKILRFYHRHLLYSECIIDLALNDRGYVLGKCTSYVV